MENDKGHGEAGKADPNTFTSMLPPREDSYDTTKLAYLADAMATNPDGLSDGPDPEENLYMPAGYTYFGQFIDHDLTLDTTSTLDPEDLKDPRKPANDPSNLRSPRFDLDCIYGTGPGDRPYMYAVADDAATETYDGASLLIGYADLARATNGRAIIGDKRNDENSIVNQIQQTFIHFHNKTVARLAKQDPNLRGGSLFRRARDEVRWTYQRIILDDFLPRIVDANTLDNFRQNHVYQLYPEHARVNLPREFVAAAYRFGHSGVRTGYRLNGTAGQAGGTILPIFKNPPAPNTDDSLVGFDPLPAAHLIDNWGRFFSSDTPRPGERLLSNLGTTIDIPDDGSDGNGAVRLQYAYKLDPSITDPLKNLPPKIASKSDVLPIALREVPLGVPGPSLALLNLLRGNRYRLQGGQSYAKKIGTPVLDPKYLCIRQSQEQADGSKRFSITPISQIEGADGPLGAVFDHDTPLWFYILAEAQVPIVDFWEENGSVDLTEEQMMGLNPDGTGMPTLPGPVDATLVAQQRKQLADTRCAGTQLRGVGGRMVAEVFYGLMESDADSVLGKRLPAGWQPVWGAGLATMPRLLRYLDPQRAPA